MKNNSDTKCLPCEEGIRPLTIKEVRQRLLTLPDWRYMSESRSIRSEYHLKNFNAAVQLLNEVARVAEENGHHPDIHLTGFRNIAFELKTHSIKALSINDLILAEKISEAASKKAHIPSH